MFCLIVGSIYLKNRKYVSDRLSGNYTVKNSKNVFFMTNGDCHKRLNGHMMGYKIRDKVLFGIAGGLDVVLTIGAIALI